MNHPNNLFHLEVEMHGAAFDDGMDGRDELTRLLLNITHRVARNEETEGNILDSNGNSVGSWRFE